MESKVKRTMVLMAIVFILIFSPILDAQEAKSGIDVSAPSADNRHSWLFTVVQIKNMTSKIISNITDGNVIFVISGFSATNNSRVVLDCALATESIYRAAQSIGYGSRIYI
jgi:hypothetical protein